MKPDPDRTYTAVSMMVGGRVQGVGFRAFVRKHARDLGLTGYVANKPDGRVHVVVEGLSEHVQRLQLLIQKGPLMARVDRVDETYIAPTHRYTNFDVSFS